MIIATFMALRRVLHTAVHSAHIDEVAAHVQHAGLEAKVADPQSVGDIAKARGMSQIAKEAGVGRESMYKSLSEDGNPSFSTIFKVVHALGGRLTIQAA